MVVISKRRCGTQNDLEMGGRAFDFCEIIFTLPLAKRISFLDKVCSSINIGRFNLFV